MFERDPSKLEKAVASSTASRLKYDQGEIRFRERKEQHRKCQDLCLKNGSSEGQNMALTVLCVPISLEQPIRNFGMLGRNSLFSS